MAISRDPATGRPIGGHFTSASTFERPPVRTAGDTYQPPASESQPSAGARTYGGPKPPPFPSTKYSLTPEVDAPLNFKKNGEPGGFNTIDLNLNGKKVGYASVGGNPYVKEGALEVKNIKIENPDLQGKGHGTNFYQELADFGKKQGADELMSDIQRKAGADGVWNKLASKYPDAVKFGDDSRWHWDLSKFKGTK